LAYRQGKKDGRAECIKEAATLKWQAECIRKMERKEEAENMKKLKLAKTGEPITISKSYGVIGPNGEDDGKRFVRKKDAEKKLVQWLRDAEQIPEEGESVDEFIERTGWTLEKENESRKSSGQPALNSVEEYRKLFEETEP